MIKILIIWILLICSSLAADLTVNDAINIEDANFGAYSNLNYGGAGNMTLYNFDHLYGSQSCLIRIKNISTLLPAHSVISSLVCSLYVYSSWGAADTFYIARILKYRWVEGTGVGNPPDTIGCTRYSWNFMGNGIDSNWTSIGCSNASDIGVDNFGDGTNYDRLLTPFDSIVIPAGLAGDGTASGWVDFNIPDTLVQQYYSGSAQEGGFLIYPKSNGNKRIKYLRTTEGSSNQPKFIFTYTIKNVTKSRVVRRIP